MPYVKFVHTADLHLDTPFKGLSQINKELSTKIKNATFSAFERIVDTCISEKVDFLLIAGDIFDREYKSLGAQLKFVDQLTRLSRENIPTYFICGNHDPLSSWLPHLDLPGMVHRFGSKEIEKVVYYKDGQPLVDIYGMSYQDKAITENISTQYQIDNPETPFSIAMLHGNLTGNAVHGNYAPFSLADLQKTGFDYWALGHIHKREVLSSKSPAIVYPGNPQGRDFGEKGEKGCYLVELGSGVDPKLSFIRTQSIRFEEVFVDLTNVNQITALNDSLATSIESVLFDDDSIIRVTLHGRTALHSQLLLPDSQSSVLERLNSEASVHVPFRFIDCILVKTRSELNIDELRKGGDFVAALIQELDSLEEDPSKATEWIETISTEITNAQLKRELTALRQQDRTEIIEESKYELLDHFLTT